MYNSNKGGYDVMNARMESKNNFPTVHYDFAAIRKQYDEYTAKCRRVSEEVEKWGKKTKPNLQFLKPKQ